MSLICAVPDLIDSLRLNWALLALEEAENRFPCAKKNRPTFARCFPREIAILNTRKPEFGAAALIAHKTWGACIFHSISMT